MRDEAATGVLVDAYRAGPIIVQLSSVFAVVAPPTAHGVAALDRAKRRLPAKTYGSLVGDRAAFWAVRAVVYPVVPDGGTSSPRKQGAIDGYICDAYRRRR